MIKNFYIDLPVSDVLFLAEIKISPLDAFNVGFEEFISRTNTFNSILNDLIYLGKIYPENTKFLKVRVPIQEDKSYCVAKFFLVKKRTATIICVKRGIDILREKHEKYYELL